MQPIWKFRCCQAAIISCDMKVSLSFHSSSPFSTWRGTVREYPSSKPHNKVMQQPGHEWHVVFFGYNSSCMEIASAVRRFWHISEGPKKSLWISCNSSWNVGWAKDVLTTPLAHTPHFKLFLIVLFFTRRCFGGRYFSIITLFSDLSGSFHCLQVFWTLNTVILWSSLRHIS